MPPTRNATSSVALAATGLPALAGRATDTAAEASAATAGTSVSTPAEEASEDGDRPPATTTDLSAPRSALGCR